MRIDSISVSGYRNLGSNTLQLQDITSLVAPNNYGKSNLLDAIRLGFGFIRKPKNQKDSMMRNRNFIPINTKLDGEPFTFEISGTVDLKNANWDFVYGYSFEWEKSNDKDHGARIINEYLKMKTGDDIKFKSYINRSSSDMAFYLASPTGRCSKQLRVDGSMLALNKLVNYDDLFYIKVIQALNNVDIIAIGTLRNPDDYFNMIAPDDDDNQMSLTYPKRGKEGYYINCLKELMPEKYELLRNTIMDLLPTIEDLQPVKVDLKHTFEGRKGEKLPFQLPDTFYDVRVKERYNNQYTTINRLSSGCKRILYILTLVIAAEINKMPIVLLEELENSVHPRLLQNLLAIISELAGDTKIIITSHSPYLIKYLDPTNVAFGMPSKDGVATFMKIKNSKVSKLMKRASSEEVSLGEYLFELMLGMEDEDTIKEYFC